MALRPALFDPENYRKPETGQDYTRANPAAHDLVELFGTNYRFNPAALLTDEDRAMGQLWSMRRAAAGGFGGGALLDPGGLMDQAAVMMEALHLMDAAAAEIQEEERQRGREARKQGGSAP